MSPNKHKIDNAPTYVERVERGERLCDNSTKFKQQNYKLFQKFFPFRTPFKA